MAYIYKYKKQVLIWHNHTGAYQNLKSFKLCVLKVISHYFNAIINVNQELNIWAINNLNSKKSYYVPNFASFANNNKITKLNGIEGKHIVCVAGLRQEKDHITLLESFVLFFKKNKNWTLHLIGKDYKDSYSNVVLNFIAVNNLNESVFLYGECRDIKNILNQSTIGVLSSISEGLPVSLLEYSKEQFTQKILKIYNEL